MTDSSLQRWGGLATIGVGICSLLYGALYVVLVVFGPKMDPATSLTSFGIQITNLLLALSGLPIPKAVEGQSLVPLLGAARDGKNATSFGWKPEPAVTEKAKSENGGAPRPHDTESYAMVFDGWKLVHNVHRSAGMQEFELYDHNADPLDSKDVAAQHADIVQSLRVRLGDWDKMVEARKLPKGGTAEGVSAKDLARLKGLGYIQ